MSERLGLVICVAVVTYRARIGGIARILAGGCYYYILVAMSVSGYLCISGKNSIADSTAYSVGKALACTSGSNAGNKYLKVSLGGDRFLRLKRDAAGGTALARGKSGLGTGGILSLKSHLCVTECIGVIGNVAVLTYGTGIGGVACMLAVGRGNIGAKVMCLGAVGKSEVIAGIVSTLDGGIVFYLNVLSVGREIKHSNHTLGTMIILGIHSLGVNEYLSNLVAVVSNLLVNNNAVYVGVSADDHRDVGMLAEELIPKAVSRIVGRIVSGSVAGCTG